MVELRASNRGSVTTVARLLGARRLGKTTRTVVHAAGGGGEGPAGTLDSMAFTSPGLSSAAKDMRSSGGTTNLSLSLNNG